MATGMVLVIVTRNIDLSVGSVLGFTGMAMAAIQVQILPSLIGYESPLIWIITLLLGVGLGALIGGLQGVVIAYFGVPSFIVTLGGLLVWRGGAWWLTSGRTVAPLDDTFGLMGGGADGSLGANWTWILALAACIAVGASIYFARKRRVRFGFPLRPVWAEAIIAAVTFVFILGAAAIVNAYEWPAAIARRYAEANNITPPEGGPVDRIRGRRAGADGHRRRHRHDLRDQAHPLRPLRLRHRRQPGSGRARRHQRALGAGQGVHADGRACGAGCGDLLGSA